MNDTSVPRNLVSVRGTELLADDTREHYREKIARITLDSMVQFVGLLDAEGTVLEINQVALDGVGIKLCGRRRPAFLDDVLVAGLADEINAELRDSIRRAAAGEFVRWDAEIYGRAGGKETIIIDASLMPVKDEHGKVVFIAAEGRDITEKKALRARDRAPARGTGQARRAEDAVLRQHQPRVPHPADADAGPARGRAADDDKLRRSRSASG